MNNTRESLGKILYPALLIVVFGLVLVFTVRGPGADQPDYTEVADATSQGMATDGATPVAIAEQGAVQQGVSDTGLIVAVQHTETEPEQTDDAEDGAAAPDPQLPKQIVTADSAPNRESVAKAEADAVVTMAALGKSEASADATERSESAMPQPPAPETRPVATAPIEKEVVALIPSGPAPLPVVRAKESRPEQPVAAADVTPNIGGPTVADLLAGGADGGPVQVHEHTVRLGETLTDIARAYDIDIDTILAANNIPDPNRIRSGDKLSVPNVRGVIHEVKRGESLWHIANNYDVTVDDIAVANELDNPNALRVGQSLVIPGAQAIAGNSLRESLVSANGSLLRNFSWPVTGRISSTFGMRSMGMHYGLDIAVVTGTPVRAAAAGKITYSADAGSYGLLVKIDHGNGIETRYAHNSRLVARNGQRVARGEIIAYSGNTGRSTGPHVHFEIRRNGGALDPLDFLR